MINAQEWLDRNYLYEERASVEELDITPYQLEKNNLLAKNEKLEGELNLQGFTRLRKLRCGGNKITSLRLSDCSNLRELRCRSNQIIKLDTSKLVNLNELDCAYNELTNLGFIRLLPNPKKLTRLSIEKNKFEPCDLTIFSRFTNLEDLELSDNPFFGSLESLKNMNNLWDLDISDTNIDSGLESLSESLTSITCRSRRGSWVEVRKIAKELEHFSINSKDGEYDFEAYKKWKKKGGKIVISQEEVDKIVSVQEWLDQNYPQETREGIKVLNLTPYSLEDLEEVLDLRESKWSSRLHRLQEEKIFPTLEGSLNLANFDDLQRIHCDKGITELNISHCPNLRIIDFPERGTETKKSILSSEKNESRVVQSLAEQLKTKRSSLENSLDESKNKLKKRLGKELGLLLDTLLEIRVNIIKEGNDSLAEEKFESLASVLEKKIGEKFSEEVNSLQEELENIHQIQKKITYLDEIIQSELIEAKIEMPVTKK